MKYKLQNTMSPSGPWANSPEFFRSKKAAKEFFDDLCDTEGLDWRVGFLCRMRDGKFFRVVETKTGVEIR